MAFIEFKPEDITHVGCGGKFTATTGEYTGHEVIIHCPCCGGDAHVLRSELKLKGCHAVGDSKPKPTPKEAWQEMVAGDSAVLWASAAMVNPIVQKMKFPLECWIRARIDKYALADGMDSKMWLQRKGYEGAELLQRVLVEELLQHMKEG